MILMSRGAAKKKFLSLKFSGWKIFFSRMKRHFGIFFSLPHPRSNFSCGSFFRNQFYERWKGDVFFLPTRIDRATTIEHINFFLLLLWKPHIRPGATEIWVCARLFLLSLTLHVMRSQNIGFMIIMFEHLSTN